MKGTLELVSKGSRLYVYMSVTKMWNGIEHFIFVKHTKLQVIITDYRSTLGMRLVKKVQWNQNSS